jgi:hemerythrin-like metal-binding protein
MTQEPSMPLIQWGPELEVGRLDIDSQHYALVRITNDLADAMQLGRGRYIISEAIDRLAAYARFHFLTEENLMAKHGYERTAAHKREHAELLAKVCMLQANSGRLAVSIETMAFLRDWLSNHILRSDRALAAALNAVHA